MTASAAALPLLRTCGDIVALRNGQPLPTAGFLAEIEAMARRLPDGRHVINLCADRYRFVVAWAAAMLRGQVTLLPNSRDPGTLASLAAEYPTLYAVTDTEPAKDVPVPQLRYPALDVAPGAVAGIPAFPADLLAAILFTSGSTGRPTPVPRRWGRLVASSIAAGTALAMHRHAGAPLVATVPHGHSYGLESAIMLPLQHGLLLTADSPMFPADIRSALAGPAAKVFVTTPVHLRAVLMDAQSRQPGTLGHAGLVLSATAPLSMDLARRVEDAFHAPLCEIYGCSEAGQLATRRTVDGPVWHCLSGFSLRQTAAGCLVSAPGEDDVLLADDIGLRGDGGFVLRGRMADMVDVAGKRSSLAYLTHQLLSIDGVDDGVFILPDGDDAGAPRRLVAVAVAPGLDAATLRAALRARIDPVFLPRPLHIVDALPRNATGKLPRAELLRLARLVQAPALLHFAPGHPASAGHFPGDPLIPGAAVLDAVIAALFADDWCGTIDAVKFSHPVRPGDSLALDCQAGARSARFQGRLPSGDVAISGTLALTMP